MKFQFREENPLGIILEMNLNILCWCLLVKFNQNIRMFSITILNFKTFYFLFEKKRTTKI
jgi:hypothetical protein